MGFHFPHAVLWDGRVEDGREVAVVITRWGFPPMDVFEEALG